jgi:hypothetical protein
VEDLIVSVRLPRIVSSATAISEIGSARFDLSSTSLIWSIGKVSNARMECVLTVPEGHAKSLRGLTACMQFRMRGWNASDVKVDSVHVSGVNYTPYKGCRYTTCGGKIDVRL